jgi:hypothetical protein
MHEDEILTGIALTEYIILQGQMTAMMQHAKSHNLGQACLRASIYMHQQTCPKPFHEEC